MAIKATGRNKQFYIQYTDAYITGGTMILSCGSHQSAQNTTGTVSNWNGKADIRLQTAVHGPNEGQANKIILFRSPDGKLYANNIGTYVTQDKPGKLELMTAGGWPMILHRPVAPESPVCMSQN